MDADLALSPAGNCPGAVVDEVIEMKSDGTGCIKRLKLQIDEVDKSVDIVLLTIGGNDIRFDEIVGHCFAYGTIFSCQEKIKDAQYIIKKIHVKPINVAINYVTKSL